MDNNKKIFEGRRSILKTGTLALAGLATHASFSTQSSAAEKPKATVSGAALQPYASLPQQAPVAEGIVPLPGGAGLYYWDTGGKGPAVVFSHPGRGSALTWPYQQPYFAAQGFRTIAYSRRGRYGSPAGDTQNGGNYADDLDALVKHLGVDTFHIVGLAAGGFALSDYAVSYPHKLLSMTVACSLFGLWDDNIDGRSDFILPKEFAKLPPEFKELGPAYRWANPEGVAQWKQMEEKSKGEGVRVRQRAKSIVTWEKLRSAKIPTLFLTGGADLYQPPSMMRAAAKELPWSETLVVPEAGHAVQWEQPDIFNQVVTDFVRRQS